MEEGPVVGRNRTSSSVRSDPGSGPMVKGRRRCPFIRADSTPDSSSSEVISPVEIFVTDKNTEGKEIGGREDIMVSSLVNLLSLK